MPRDLSHHGTMSTTIGRSGIAASGAIRGECLCGAVAFLFELSRQYGPDRVMGFCHCTRCQRWSGGPGLPFVVATPERFRIIRGQGYMAHYRDETLGMRAFCRYCGSSLYQDIGTTYYVAAGVLRDLELTPGFHLHVGEKAPWDHVAGDAPQFEETPNARPRTAI